MAQLEELWKIITQGRKGQNIGKSTGMPKLDKVIGGIQPHRYYLVSAASSVGKTSFVLYMMYNLLKQINEEKPVYFLYFSLEIGEDVLLAKLMALYCAEEFGIYLTIDDMFSFMEPLNDYAYECLEKAREWIETVSKYIVIVESTVSANSVYKCTLEFAETIGTFEKRGNRKVYIPNNPHQLIIGVLDHFSLIRCEEGRKLKEDIDELSKYMVTLKKKLPLSWFALMQQNRESSSMDRRKADLSEPGLNDLKDSGNPGQDSDVVLQLFFPFREKLSTYRGFKVLGDDGIGEVLRSIIVSKNRYGIANRVICTGFWGSVGWFKELPEPDKITDFTKFLTERGNIPCKYCTENEDDSTVDKETGEVKKPITFSF